MDYKRQSSRDNEEKQNANAHCSGCCGNCTAIVVFFFFFKLLFNLRSELQESNT